MKKFTILVIDSDVEPIYKLGREIWRINAAKHGVEIFFLRATKDIEDDSITISQDVIYTKWVNDLEGRLIDKTLKGFKHILKSEDQQYILRTNLSSFFNLGLFKEFISILPDSSIYAGSIESIELEMPDKIKRGINFCSGSGFIVSRDIASLVLERERGCPRDLLDDVWMSLVLIDIQRLGFQRCNLTNLKQIDASSIIAMNQKIEQAISENCFQYRIKNEGQAPREQLDAPAWVALATRFL